MLKFNKTSEKEPPIDTPLLVVRKADGLFHRTSYYEIAMYRRLGHAVDSMRAPQSLGVPSQVKGNGMFHDGKNFINASDCPLWLLLGPVPEIK